MSNQIFLQWTECVKNKYRSKLDDAQINKNDLVCKINAKIGWQWVHTKFWFNSRLSVLAIGAFRVSWVCVGLHSRHWTECDQCIRVFGVFDEETNKADFKRHSHTCISLDVRAYTIHSRSLFDNFVPCADSGSTEVERAPFLAKPVRLTPAWEANNLPNDELNFRGTKLNWWILKGWTIIAIFSWNRHDDGSR